MSFTLPEQRTAEKLNKAAAFHDYLAEQKDAQTAEKAGQLARKISRDEFTIAFCGHFSAGKSSMVNKIIGEDLLPSSPIPTSANLVKIKAGEDYAKVYFKEGNPRLYPAPYDYERVKQYCRDGGQIHSIEISKPGTILPENIAVMDTPGIDSADDAHRISTESALHLSDLIFYVMDYNHVQSELNFLFTKELAAAGKEIYLIINQIDKHREEEISMAKFKASVRESFSSWGVQPEHIFYTSLKQEEHPHNEFGKLRQFIHEKMALSKELLPRAAEEAIKRLADEHIRFLEALDESEEQRLNGILEGLPGQRRETLEKDAAALADKLNKRKAERDSFQEHLGKELEKVLKNAYLMPYQTRELAEKYLESRQPGFKVGLFFSRQKTGEESARRLDAFYQDLHDRVRSELVWHIKEVFSRTIKEKELLDPELLEAVQSFSIPFTAQMIEQTVKSGAMLTGEYVLNYTEDVASAVKKTAKDHFEQIKNIMIQKAAENSSEAIEKSEAEYREAKGLAEAWISLNEMKEKQLAAKMRLEQVIHEDYPSDQLSASAIELTADTETAEVAPDEEEDFLDKVNDKAEMEEEEIQFAGRSADPDDIIKKLLFTAEKLKGVPGFSKTAAELARKAARLKDKDYTVALFGAFSAGKSSFANALIGERLLPVSPNPTTAAINKIRPVDHDHTHGTSLVHFKTAEVLYGDVNRSLKAFNEQATDLEDALRKIGKLSEAGDLNSSEKTHLAFLNAFSKGYPDYRAKLGDTMTVSLAEFGAFVADEEKSCLVELIEVFYDCPLTRQGITLVDTPGADSINARHTGVAFDYIKNSDAILFVTYYNHAFSRADREFLIQLGRVKESFELDKMFFAVNAVDLASSEEEMESVLRYVEDQLTQYGIRRPHLNPVSSLLGLQEKLGEAAGKSYLAEFEERFYSFISSELSAIAVNSAENEWERAIGQLRSFIRSSREDESAKQMKREKIAGEKAGVRDILEKGSSLMLKKRLEQEADELIFYIKQRVFFRFGDFIKEAFNPSVLKDDGRNMKKALQDALADFLSSFGFDFAQEMRATSLRLEVFAGKLAKEAQASLVSSISKISGDITFTEFEVSSHPGLDFTSAFSDLEPGLFKKALSYFKSPKTFFEQNGRKQLGEELHKVLDGPADNYLASESSRLKDYYARILEEEYRKLTAEMADQAAEYYEGISAALSDEIPLDKLIELERSLVQFTSGSKG